MAKNGRGVAMPQPCTLHVHLSPALIPAEHLAGAVAVVIDVLRATTTIVHALAAGCAAVLPCAEMDEARSLARTLPGKILLGGEREGLPLPGFDLGNSPGEYTPAVCRDATLVLTTSNGTRALLHASAAKDILAVAFVNLAAVCEHLRHEARPVHVLCAGDAGQPALEDTLLAGALVQALDAGGQAQLNDGARLALACFGVHGHDLGAALRLGAGGARLRALGYDEDIRAAAQVDRFALVPEVRRDPLRVVNAAR
jgi:2-phosphosulfolactate phosphatase